MLFRPHIVRQLFVAAIATAVALGSLAASPSPAFSAENGWAWPLVGDVITPYKNGSDPYAAGQHRGVDIAAPVGTPARAIVGGKVSYAGNLPDGGITVTVRSNDDRYLVSFLHLSSRSVSRGAAVEVGQVLGAVGTSGKRSAEQPHLHLGVRLAARGSYVDPMTLLGTARVAQLTTGGDESAQAKPVSSSPPVAAAPHHVVSKRSPTRLSSIEPRVVTHRTAAKHVHAQPTGDRVPTAAGSVGSSTGDSARESHASENGKTGRVAPPPLPVAPLHVEEPEVTLSSPSAKANRAPAAVTAQTRAATPGRRFPWRFVLIALAVGCLIALATRRRPSALTSRPSSPSVTGLAEEKTVSPIRIVS